MVFFLCYCTLSTHLEINSIVTTITSQKKTKKPVYTSGRILQKQIEEFHFSTGLPNSLTDITKDIGMTISMFLYY